MTGKYSGMPTREAIAEFWDEFPEECWKCRKRSRGRDGVLERAHIIPIQLKGLNVVSNLVILCKACHLAAPDVDDPLAMWEFIEKGDEAGMEFLRDSIRVTSSLFTTPGTAGFLAAYPDLFLGEIQEAANHAGIHAGKFSYSTRMWIIERASASIQTRATHFQRHGAWCPVCLEDHTQPANLKEKAA